jgi:hypothetical protein
MSLSCYVAFSTLVQMVLLPSGITKNQSAAISIINCFLGTEFECIFSHGLRNVAILLVHCLKMSTF